MSCGACSASPCTRPQPASSISSLVRADQKAKQHAAALEESKEEALGKLEEAQEARVELEARVATLEFRLEALERTLAREDERRRQSLMES